jgi:hypothetical protein
VVRFSGPPASSSSTLTEGFSVSLEATILPALPAPTIMKSYQNQFISGNMEPNFENCCSATDKWPIVLSTNHNGVLP